MALNLDSNLELLVASAREQAIAAGDFPLPGDGPAVIDLPDVVRKALVQIIEDGTYAQAVAEVVATDPELADI